VSEALSELTSSELVDEDAAEYIISILEGDARDTESRDTVASILSSIVEDEDEGAVEQFFERLDAKLSCGVTSSMEAVSIADDQENTLRKLDTAITMKQHDVQTFASGLVAEKDPTMDQEGQSNIQAFYANMIDVTNNPKALSERNRRKERQKQMRQKMEDDERKRAVEDELRMLEEDLLKSSNEANAQELTTANDNAADVHFIRFSLPNKKGGGPDLIVDSTIQQAMMCHSKCRKWLVFSDLHVMPSTLSTCIQVLNEVHATAQRLDAGILFLGDFWHHRGVVRT